MASNNRAGSKPKSTVTEAKRQGGRPTLEEARALTDRILKVATRHFLEHGYQDTTFERIAKEAGTSKGALYLRYPEKVALFSAVCEGLIADLYRSDIVQMNRDLPMRACLEQQGRALIAAALNPTAVSLYKMIINDAPRHEELAKSTASVWDFYVTQMEDYLKSRIDVGRLLLRDTRRAAEHFAQMIFGPTHVALVHGRELPQPEEISHHVTETVLIFLGGIGRLEVEGLDD